MELALEECSSKYWEFVRLLRQDSRVKDGFIENVKISKIDQIKYMTLNWQNYFIAVINNIPVGYVGVIDNDIRICTHPNFQGKGVGKFMIKEIHKKYPNAIARVKLKNVASSKLFLACNFVEFDSDNQFIYFKTRI